MDTVKNILEGVKVGDELVYKAYRSLDRIVKVERVTKTMVACDNGIETGLDIEPVDYACSVIWVFRDLVAGGRTEYSEQIVQIFRMAMEYLKLFIKSEGIDPYDQRIECVSAVYEAMQLLSAIKISEPKN